MGRYEHLKETVKSFVRYESYPRRVSLNFTKVSYDTLRTGVTVSILPSANPVLDLLTVCKEILRIEEGAI